MTDYVIQIDYQTCRICYEDDKIHNLIYPCKCTGNTKYVHLKCLNTWRKTSITHNITCEICTYKYKILTPYFNSFFEKYLENSIYIQFFNIFIIFILSTIFYGCDSNKIIPSSIINNPNNILSYRIYYILSFLTIFLINIFVVSSNIYSLSTQNKQLYLKSFIHNNYFKYILFITIFIICILYYYTFNDGSIYIDIIYSILLSDIFNRTHIYTINSIENIDDEYIENCDDTLH
jgi:hypothetical protein